MATLDHRHLPPYLTDRLLARVLPPEVAGAVTRQEQTCDDCRERLEQARRAEAAYLARHPPEQRVRELLQARTGRPRRGRRVLAWGLPLLSAAAAAGVLVFKRAANPPVSPQEVLGGTEGSGQGSQPQLLGPASGHALARAPVAAASPFAPTT